MDVLNVALVRLNLRAVASNNLFALCTLHPWRQKRLFDSAQCTRRIINDDGLTCFSDLPMPSSTAVLDARTRYPCQNDSTGASLEMFHCFRKDLKSTARADVHTADVLSLSIMVSDCREFWLENANSIATSPMLSPKLALGEMQGHPDRRSGRSDTLPAEHVYLPLLELLAAAETSPLSTTLQFHASSLTDHMSVVL